MSTYTAEVPHTAHALHDYTDPEDTTPDEAVVPVASTSTLCTKASEGRSTNARASAVVVAASATPSEVVPRAAAACATGATVDAAMSAGDG